MMSLKDGIGFPVSFPIIARVVFQQRKTRKKIWSRLGVYIIVKKKNSEKDAFFRKNRVFFKRLVLSQKSI
jgi:hypothetical protein